LETGCANPVIAAAAEELVAVSLQNGALFTGPTQKSASGIQQFTDRLLPVHHSVTEAPYAAPIVQHPLATVRGASMNDFARLLEAEIPRLRRYARALTRDVSRADDLVQSCLVRAVSKQHLWQPGTDLRAWLFTILHNQHVNEVRRSVREGANVPIEDAAPALTVQPNAVDALQLRDLERALAKLAPEQRQVILLVGLEGMPYEEVASILDIPIGTVRSRLSRGRGQLRILMGMDDGHSALPAPESGRAAGHASAA
jgi:RNA polymerase sigma-70 factor (ECF subfamily)